MRRHVALPYLVWVVELRDPVCILGICRTCSVLRLYYQCINHILRAVKLSSLIISPDIHRDESHIAFMHSYDNNYEHVR